MAICFVVMGFGKKTDFATGRSLDLDKAYKNMVKPAVESAGLQCIRADEIVHSGLIDVPMYDQLLKADVVVADLFDFEYERILRAWNPACPASFYDGGD
jgi:hypothetical protein